MKTRHDPATKPYYRCLSCHRFRKTCAGLPTRDMDQENWCEYMRDIKEAFHLTNAYIAKEADVSTKTVENIMALKYEKDVTRVTARRIELAVIGSISNHHCHLDYDDSTLLERIAQLQAEVEHWRKEAEYWRKENERNAKIIDKYLDNT